MARSLCGSEQCCAAPDSAESQAGARAGYPDIWVMPSAGGGAACPYTNTDLCGTVTTVKLDADQFEVDREHLFRMV